MKTIRKTKGARRTRTISYLRGKLLERRETLLRQLQDGVSASMETNRNPSDDVDLANAEIALETEYEIGSVEYKAVAEIDNALRRIETGKYGICEDCGEKIPEARLKAIPFAYLCVKCKEQEEREGEAADPFAFNWDALTELSGGEEEPSGEAEHAVYRGTTKYPE